MFVNANRGKRSLALDLKSSRGRAVLDRLLGRADVFLHNMRPAAATRLGLQPETICDGFPRLVYCAVPGFGSEGPYRDLAAYDDVIQGDQRDGLGPGRQRRAAVRAHRHRRQGGRRASAERDPRRALCGARPPASVG